MWEIASFWGFAEVDSPLLKSPIYATTLVHYTGVPEYVTCISTWFLLTRVFIWLIAILVPQGYRWSMIPIIARYNINKLRRAPNWRLHKILGTFLLCVVNIPRFWTFQVCWGLFGGSGEEASCVEEVSWMRCDKCTVSQINNRSSIPQQRGAFLLFFQDQWLCDTHPDLLIYGHTMT